ncbi:hypothetical protein Bca4012_076752 [Brassica carinata]
MVRFIRQEAEEKANEISISASAYYSTQLNASRINHLQSQDDIVTDSVAKDLLRVSNNRTPTKSSPDLLRLKEPSVLLRCREMDNKVVESIIEDAKKHYAEKAKVASPNITIDEKVFLPPPPNPKLPDSHDLHCWGGVVERLSARIL